ncbi:TetR family transcriptional regulator [Bacillus sp. JCM 19041]|uniref:TetR/AcrR family transcriptional regulator n=1 Tax=Bacillus sp. JCM 19041 TaxID=1460637 RepID=UPI0006D0073C
MTDQKPFSKEDVHPLSLRERKKRQAQIDIEEAALHLFQQKGYEQTSIKDIADEVMLSSRTFFRYYSSKEEVLTRFLQTPQTDLSQSIQRIKSTASPHAALCAIFHDLANKYQDERSNFLIRYEIAMQASSISSLFLYTLLESEPAIRDELNAHLENTDEQEIHFLVALYMSAFRVSIEKWLRDKETNLVSIITNHMDQLISLSTETNQTS